jgi:hypothetical protein
MEQVMTVKATLRAVLEVVAPTFPVIAPQGTTGKRLTYQGIGGGDSSTFDADDESATRALIQVDAWAEDYGTAERLSKQARAAIYVGMTVGEITDNPDDYEEETKLFRVSFSVLAWE